MAGGYSFPVSLAQPPSGYAGQAWAGYDAGTRNAAEQTMNQIRQMHLASMIQEGQRQAMVRAGGAQVMGAPDQPITLAEGMPGTPGTPETTATVAPDVPVAPETPESFPVTTPGTPATPGTPPVTRPGMTMGDVRNLVGPATATAMATTPEGQRIMQARGVMSDKELAGARAHATAMQELPKVSKDLNAAMVAGDSVKTYSLLAAFYQRQALLLASTDPERSQQASTQMTQAIEAATKLQHSKNERALADDDLPAIAGAIAKATSDPTLDNVMDAVKAVQSGKAETTQDLGRQMMLTSVPKLLTHIQDAGQRTFMANFIAAGAGQTTKDEYAAFQQAVKATPNSDAIITRAILTDPKSGLGQLAMRSYFGRPVPSNTFELAKRQVLAEGQFPATLPDGSENPAFLADIRTKVNAGVNSREDLRHSMDMWRIAHTKVQEIGQDIARLNSSLKAEQGKKFRADPDRVAGLQQQIDDKQREHDAAAKAEDMESETVRISRGRAPSASEANPAGPGAPPPPQPSVTPAAPVGDVNAQQAAIIAIGKAIFNKKDWSDPAATVRGLSANERAQIAARLNGGG